VLISGHRRVLASLECNVVLHEILGSSMLRKRHAPAASPPKLRRFPRQRRKGTVRSGFQFSAGHLALSASNMAEKLGDLARTAGSSGSPDQALSASCCWPKRKNVPHTLAAGVSGPPETCRTTKPAPPSASVLCAIVNHAGGPKRKTPASPEAIFVPRCRWRGRIGCLMPSWLTNEVNSGPKRTCLGSFSLWASSMIREQIGRLGTSPGGLSLRALKHRTPE
jgi:hypothetical protein